MVANRSCTPDERFSVTKVYRLPRTAYTGYGYGPCHIDTSPCVQWQSDGYGGSSESSVYVYVTVYVLPLSSTCVSVVVASGQFVSTTVNVVVSKGPVVVGAMIESVWVTTSVVITGHAGSVVVARLTRCCTAFGTAETPRTARPASAVSLNAIILSRTTDLAHARLYTARLTREPSSSQGRLGND
ncbi:uncharacterized protein C8Q71DRAFT_741526 [Rhodofomes roseus]|uniref:Uncharacterized protein n=1 Tax=Rhodofomes roseus TaxID=34475 RepID=A0ABQ8KQD3_9APHY|nr:uncharacterized protein C8Q71DRAFT_741526 [Rhodofomes roseus]KAH9840832.1 hypothetical protein C8Q71DRAFT_741526 [Rhodofomes roseus]